MQTTCNKATYARLFRNSIRPLIGLLVGVAGLTNMVSAITLKFNWDVLLGAWPVDMPHCVNKLIVVIGFFLVMLSYGLMRGKCQAWRATLILLLLSASLYILTNSFVMAIVTLALVTLLIMLSASFQAKSDPPSLRRGYLVLFAGLGIVTLYAVGGFLALYNDFEPLFDQFGIDGVILGLLTHSHLLPLTHGTEAFVFGRALPTLCLSAVLYGVVLILRPVAAVLHPDEQEQQVASTLTHLYGTNSISYFALEAGKSYFFSASGKSFMSYVLEGNVAVVAGDPIGPDEEMLPVMQQFIAFCHEQDWTVVFWQVRDMLADLYRSAGLHLLKIGEDAVIDTHAFTLAGKAMANIRSSAKRAEKEGIHIEFSRGQVKDVEQLAQMEQISRAWLAVKGGAEMRFSMGQFDASGDDEQVYALAIDTTNKVHAFVTFVPIYGRNGWALDLMRRAEQAAPGTMELLLARSIEHLKSGGADIVSLGLAPRSNINHTDETLLETGIDFLTHIFGNSSTGQSLFNFKKKFQSQWESRYLVFSHTLTLPRVGWALYHAHQRDASLPTALYKLLKDVREKQQVAHKKVIDLTGAARHAATGGLSL